MSLALLLAGTLLPFLLGSPVAGASPGLTVRAGVDRGKPPARFAPKVGRAQASVVLPARSARQADTRKPDAGTGVGPGTWEHQAPLPTSANLNDVDMISPLEGWATGQ